MRARWTAALLAAGCIRLNPLYHGPDYHFRTEAKDGVLGSANQGALDPQGSDAWAQGFRFDLPAPGQLLLSVKPGDPSAQLDMDVYTDGKIPVASTAQQADKKLVASDLPAGPVYVVVHEPWRTGAATSFRLTPIFKPADPDAAQTTCKTQATARELPAQHGRIEDGVDYSAMRRTCWWHLALAAEGGLSIKFDNRGANLSAEFVGPSGAPQKIDPVAGLSQPDLPAGDYYVKVYADDAGDAGRYALATSYTPGDTCKNGGDACAIEGAEQLNLPADSKTADVDYSGKQFHYYKVSLKSPGELSINFKALQRGSHLSAAFLKGPDDDGENVAGGSLQRQIDAPGDYYIRVEAPEPGDAGKYALTTSWQPVAVIAADVVEIGESPCKLTVSAGTNQNVRPGEACTVTAASGQPIEACVVDSVYANLSEVRPLKGCSLPDGAKVQITAAP